MDMESRPEVQPGRYRHYKGGLYTVIGVARHSETEELLVVYRPEYGARELWVRPLAMFQEAVTVDGRSQPRFAPVDDSQPSSNDGASRNDGAPSS